MSTRMEECNPDQQTWKNLNKIDPNTSGFIYQHLPDGEQKLYMLYCNADNSSTILFESDTSNTVQGDKGLEIHGEKTFKKVIELKKGEESYLLSAKFSSSSPRRMFRFTHE